TGGTLRAASVLVRRDPARGGLRLRIAGMRYSPLISTRERAFVPQFTACAHACPALRFCGAATCEAIDYGADQRFRHHWLVQDARDIQSACSFRRETGYHNDGNVSCLQMEEL